MTMKEKAGNILGGFLDRNQDYAVELYINNAVTNSRIGKLFILSDHIYETDDKKIIIKWNKDANYDVRYNEFSIPYDEIMKCYEEMDQEGNIKTSETVIIIFKNGMEFDFECCGVRL